MVSICGCWTKATVKGADLDPGQIIAVFKPQRTRVSAMMEAHRVLRLRESRIVVTGFVLMFYLIRTDRFVFYNMKGSPAIVLNLEVLWVE